MWRRVINRVINWTGDKLRSEEAVLINNRIKLILVWCILLNLIKVVDFFHMLLQKVVVEYLFYFLLRFVIWWLLFNNERLLSIRWCEGRWRHVCLDLGTGVCWEINTFFLQSTLVLLSFRISIEMWLDLKAVCSCILLCFSVTQHLTWIKVVKFAFCFFAILNVLYIASQQLLTSPNFSSCDEFAVVVLEAFSWRLFKVVTKFTGWCSPL